MSVIAAVVAAAIVAIVAVVFVSATVTVVLSCFCFVGSALSYVWMFYVL